MFNFRSFCNVLIMHITLTYNLELLYVPCACLNIIFTLGIGKLMESKNKGSVEHWTRALMMLG